MIFQDIRKRNRKNTIGNVYALLITVVLFIAAAYFFITFQNKFPVLSSIVLAAAILLPVVFIIRKNFKLTSSNNLLAAQQHYLLSAVNNTSDGIIITDLSSNIHYMNAAAEKLTGSAFKDVYNQPLANVYHIENEKTALPLENVVTRVLKTGIPIINENNTVLKNNNQQKIIITNSCNPLFTGDDLCGAVLVFNECMTAAGTNAEKGKQETNRLIQQLPQAVYTCDERGFIQLYNKAAVALWGREPECNKEKWCGAAGLFYSSGKPIEHENSPMALAIKQQRAFDAAEIIIQQPNGNYRQVIMHPAPLFNANGKLTGAVNMMVDVTEKKCSEELARHNEDKYYTLVEQASEAIFITDTMGNLLETNAQATVLTGYSKQELKAMNIARLFPKNDFENNFQLFEKIISGNERMTKELTAVNKDKRQFPVHISAKKLPDGRLMAIAKDLTYIKEEENRISKAVVDAQEAERQYLGMELHDNINQLLTGTLLMLGAAGHAQMNKEEILKLIGSCKNHLTAAVEEIRNLSHRLSPAAFTTSLQQECVLLIKQMSVSAGFTVTHNLNIINEKILPSETKICLYRILQEQLSNICKHSRAKKIHISLLQGGNTVNLKISDDGIGFTVNAQNKGIGINNIKKRVGYFSGKFNLVTSPGNGCTVEVELPYTPVLIS